MSAAGGKKKKIWNGIKTAIAFAVFLIYIVPFVLVLINSLKRKVNIVREPLTLIDDQGVQFVNYINFDELRIWHMLLCVSVPWFY